MADRRMLIGTGLRHSRHHLLKLWDQSVSLPGYDKRAWTILAERLATGGDPVAVLAEAEKLWRSLVTQALPPLDEKTRESFLIADDVDERPEPATHNNSSPEWSERPVDLLARLKEQADGQMMMIRSRAFVQGGIAFQDVCTTDELKELVARYEELLFLIERVRIQGITSRFGEQLFEAGRKPL